MLNFKKLRNSTEREDKTPGRSKAINLV
jgi:hypothetical protein